MPSREAMGAILRVLGKPLGIKPITSQSHGGPSANKTTELVVADKMSELRILKHPSVSLYFKTRTGVN